MQPRQFAADAGAPNAIVFDSSGTVLCRGHRPDEAQHVRIGSLVVESNEQLARTHARRVHLVEPESIVLVFAAIYRVAVWFDAPADAYNIADDQPAPQDEVVAYAARLLGQPDPPIVPLESLSPQTRAFYAESRRVANGKAKRVLGWSPLYPGYREGLRALSATTSPAKVSAAPSAAVTDQR